MLKNLNENIKSLRMRQGISQVEFAKKMAVTKQCVSNWENDNVLPSVEMLNKIADYFNVTTDFLLGRDVDNALNVNGLSEEEITHLRLIIDDLKCARNHQD